MIYQHLPTISEKMNTLEDILRKFIGCLRFIHYITAWANFHFPHPCPTLSACQEDSVDEAEVEVGTFQPSQVIQVVLATPISNSNPSTCYMYIGHPGHLHLPNVNEYISISTLSLLIDKSRGLQAPVPVPGACNKMEIGIFPRYF